MKLLTTTQMCELSGATRMTLNRARKDGRLSDRGRGKWRAAKAAFLFKRCVMKPPVHWEVYASELDTACATFTEKLESWGWTEKQIEPERVEFRDVLSKLDSMIIWYGKR